MFSDYVITIAGRSVTITSHDLMLISGSLLINLVFWAAVYFSSRKQTVVLKRSTATEQVTRELSRVAEALERIANGPADRAIATAWRQQQEENEVLAGRREPLSSRYSLLGR
jgi:biopolymer transport protein ExbB/TolQ